MELKLAELEQADKEEGELDPELVGVASESVGIAGLLFIALSFLWFELADPGVRSAATHAMRFRS